MVSRCANPVCSEVFRYLHQGRLYCLTPAPGVRPTAGALHPSLEERFWLCDKCAKQMTLVWTGSQIELAGLSTSPPRTVSDSLPPQDGNLQGGITRGRAASAGQN